MTIQQHIHEYKQMTQQWLLAQSIRIYTRLETEFVKHVNTYRAEYQLVGVIVVWYCVAAAFGWCVGAILAVI